MASESQAPAGGAPQESTFRNYNAKQASTYTQSRAGYLPKLYKVILDAHEARGGKAGSVLDVGCGPGRASREIADYFDEVTGVDPSPGMIAEAIQTGGKTKAGNDISYKVCSAEELDSLPGQVDMITAATAVGGLVSLLEPNPILHTFVEDLGANAS